MNTTFKTNILKIFSTILLLFCLSNTVAQNFDINVLRDINLNRNSSLDASFRGITNSAAPIAYSLPIVLLVVGLFRKDSLTKQKSLYVGASLITSAIISTALKYGINRPRPFITYAFLQKVAEGGSPSFPSGHTSDIFAAATSLSIAFPKWYVIAPSLILAGAVGYSRMDLGVHYPSDVLVGAIIGSGSAYFCCYLYKRHNFNNQLKQKK